MRRKQIIAAGIERVARTTGVQDGYPLLEDGRVLEVSNVIWCTGYTPDFSWIDLPLATRHGFPIQNRGIVESVPGLYFIGLLFLYSISSALVGGVGRDAEHIVDHIAAFGIAALICRSRPVTLPPFPREALRLSTAAAASPTAPRPLTA